MRDNEALLKRAALEAVLAWTEHEIIMDSGHGHDDAKVRSAMKALKDALSSKPTQTGEMGAAIGVH